MAKEKGRDYSLILARKGGGSAGKRLIKRGAAVLLSALLLSALTPAWSPPARAQMAEEAAAIKNEEAFVIPPEGLTYAYRPQGTKEYCAVTGIDMD